MLQEYAIVAFALAGFSVAFYIWWQKRQPHPVTCPVGGGCDTVVRSEYSHFLGIPLELLGLIYYGAVAASYLFFATHETDAPALLVFAVLAASFAAFLFSLYLTFIQAFLLRWWCTWCLFSALISTLIFLASTLASAYPLGFVLAEERGILIFLHLVGIAVGLGGATVGDVLFFKFLKDWRIVDFEADVLKTISQIIWLGLGLVAVSGAGLMAPVMADLAATEKIVAKLTLVAILIANSLALHLVILPSLVHISFAGSTAQQAPRLQWLRKLAFALGAISLTSWYSILLIALLPRESTASASMLLTAYGAALLLAIGLSQYVERTITTRTA